MGILMSGVVSPSRFLKSPNRLRLMILNAKKMTSLWPFRIMKKNVFAIVHVKRSYAHARICRLTRVSHRHSISEGGS